VFGHAVSLLQRHEALGQKKHPRETVTSRYLAETLFHSWAANVDAMLKGSGKSSRGIFRPICELPTATLASELKPLFTALVALYLSLKTTQLQVYRITDDQFELLGLPFSTFSLAHPSMYGRFELPAPHSQTCNTSSIKPLALKPESASLNHGPGFILLLGFSGTVARNACFSSC
jgi:hypothetical protein